MSSSLEKPIGYEWRSSRWFIVSTISIALFAETFLYGFLVPILGYIFESRLGIEPAQRQRLTSVVLAMHGVCSAISGPVIGHFVDQLPNRKSPLLLSLLGCIVGTAIVACSRSLSLFLLGRCLQGVAGSFVWIVGLATVAETTSQDRVGTVMGLVNSFAHTGIMSGPIVSGLLLETAGYWATWSIPVVILTIDIIARLLMIEKFDDPKPNCASERTDASETTGLLTSPEDQQGTPTTLGFWRTMLSNGRVFTALLVSLSIVSLSTGFDTTLPLHVDEAFGWGTGTTGFLFFCLSVPAILISPLAGWLRDRIGIRAPTTVGFVIQAILMAILGIAGNSHFSWASAEAAGPAIYMTSIVAIGIVQPFVLGVANIELTAVLKEKQEENPESFGPGGGFSRIFSMAEVASTLGLILGPILSGSLTEVFGYTYMSWTWSVLCIILAVLACRFLGSKR
ncbi:Tetracycline resistance protein TetA/multidrug resistance protein MdtG [Penicillium frequentans]|nr:Tetracycline resistance protein TetA/multidrug resistance protein MdtG [Penicillium glabrum]